MVARAIIAFTLAAALTDSLRWAAVAALIIGGLNVVYQWGWKHHK